MLAETSGNGAPGRRQVKGKKGSSRLRKVRLGNRGASGDSLDQTFQEQLYRDNKQTERTSVKRRTN
ncbi:unnamed protein product [Ixodes hexagonus]